MQPLDPYAAPAAQPLAEPGKVSVMTAVRFAFTSPHWLRNAGMNVLFMIIPVVGPLVTLGWHCEISQRLARRHEQPIPKLDFTDFGHFLMRGLIPFVMQLIITVPLVLVSYVLGVIMAVVMSVLMRGGGEETGVLIMGGAMTVIMPMLFFMSVLQQAATTRAELTEDFGESFKLGKIFAYGRKTWLTIFVTSIIFACVAIPMALVGMLLCFVGIYFVSAILQLAAVHLRWQTYEQFLTRGGEAIPLKAPVVLPSEEQLRPWPPHQYPPQYPPQP